MRKGRQPVGPQLRDVSLGPSSDSSSPRTWSGSSLRQTWIRETNSSRYAIVGRLSGSIIRQLVTRDMEWLVLTTDRDKRDEKQEVYATVGRLSGSIIRQLVSLDKVFCYIFPVKKRFCLDKE